MNKTLLQFLFSVVLSYGLVDCAAQCSVSLTSLTGTNAQTVCANNPIATITYSTTNATDANFSGLPTGVSGDWANDVVTITGASSIPNNYSYTVSLVGCNGGTAIATGSIVVNAIPNAGTLSGNQSICVGSTTSFSSNGASGGIWSSSNTAVATVSVTGVVTGVIAGTATITYTVAGTGGCSAVTATRTVTVTAAPIAGTLSGNQSICVGSTTLFSSNGASGGIWSSSNTAVATVGLTGVVTGIVAGTATITYTVTGTGGCSDVTATQTVTVTAAPSAGTLIGAPGICVGGNTTFTSSGDFGGAWSSSDTNVASVFSSTGVVMGVVGGTATITYTVAGTGGCSAVTATRAVTVTAPPSAGTLSGALGICVGGNTTFTSSGDFGGAWSSSDTNVASILSSTGVVTGVAAGTATITYAVAGTGGCSNVSATQIVSVTAAPSAGTLSGALGICVGGNTTFTSSGDFGGAWSSSDTNVASVFSSTGLVTGVVGGTATITYTVAGTGGCNNTTATRSITVNPTSNSDTVNSSQNTVCSALVPFSNSVTLIASEASVGVKTWQSSFDGVTFSDLSNSNVEEYVLNDLVTDSENEHVPVTRYFRLQTVSGVCPADYSSVLPILIKPRPFLDDQDYSICSGELFEYIPMDDLNSIIPDNTSLNYTASAQGNLSGAVSQNNQSTISAELTNLDYVDNSVIYSIIPAYEECVGSEFQVEVTVLRHPEIIASDDQSICEGESVQLFAVDLFNAPGTYFDWTSGDDESLNFPYIFNPIAEPDTFATCVVYMADPINTACYDSDTVNVYVNSIPVFEIVEPDGTFCSGNSYNFNVSQQSDIDQLLWEVSNAEIVLSDINQLTLNLENAGVVEVSAQAISLEGCIYSDEIEFVIGQTPEAVISGPSIACANSFYQNYEGYSQIGNGLAWTIENGSVTNGQGTLSVEASWFAGDEGLLILTAHDWQSGCEASDSLTVAFEGEAPGLFPIEMLGENSSVLFCANSSFEFYRWGKTTVSSGVETTFNSNLPYFEFNQIDILNYYYWLEYGDVDGCITRSYYNEPSIITSVEDAHLETKPDFHMYPNPVINLLTITAKNWMQNARIEVFTSTGVLLEDRSFSGISSQLDFSNFASGLYLVKLTTKDYAQVVSIMKR
jgi:uncharacterized protein YjdB